MDDSRKNILDSSNRFICKLQLLSVFFEEELVFKIYVRTQVIQKLFESNPELDVNKLELFHLQFTETIIELLKKIKKSNEKNVAIAEDEIVLNEELIHNISSTMHLEESFGTAKEMQTAAINKGLFRLYQNLSNLSAVAPFSKTISYFGATFSKDFFHETDAVFISELVDYDLEKVYKNGYAIIEKRLMGLQCKYEFKNVFYCGLKAGGFLIELYKLTGGNNEYFIFYPVKNLFLSVPFSKIESINLSGGISKKAKTIDDLTVKNSSLKNSINTIKTSIPAEVMQLLNEYYQKIEAMDFFHFIDDFDVQANILKAMLNTDSI